MTGSDDIDLGLENIYRSWFKYRKSKKPNAELDGFQYNLEPELFNLWQDLQKGTYKHGEYRKFTVCDNKKREISVASIRDRVIHRLVYDYLVAIFDKTFIFDAWSCRKDKGLEAAIDQTQKFMKKYTNGFIWRADISKFFNNVNHEILLKSLKLKIADKKAFKLLERIIKSFNSKEGRGIPIGNLTSQIFSNIYLNELDRYIKHYLKCRAYVRYGDDFVIFDDDRENLGRVKERTTHFLVNKLKLDLHPRNNFIIRSKYGLKFLGVILYPKGRRLNRRNKNRIMRKLNLKNTPSYWGVIKRHSKQKNVQRFQWNLTRTLENGFCKP